MGHERKRYGCGLPRVMFRELQDWGGTLMSIVPYDIVSIPNVFCIVITCILSFRFISRDKPFELKNNSIPKKKLSRLEGKKF